MNISTLMTNDQLQDMALRVQSLLEAADALDQAEDCNDRTQLIHIARERARRLNIALDGLNRNEGEEQ